jgi:hypothetical protein
VSAPKHAGIARECCDSVLDSFVVIGRGRLLVGDIQVVTADEPNPQHNACHARSLRAYPVAGAARAEADCCYE